VHADGRAHARTLLLEPHVALALGVAWRQLCAGPVVGGGQHTDTPQVGCAVITTP
jgi:hypothetical protein